VRDFKGNDPRFISYFLLTLDFLAASDKAAVPGVNRNHLHEMTVKIPDSVTQLQIGEVLGSLDDRISLLRETNATLEAVAQALFKSWFVDFDPVRAKSEGRAPEDMDEATAALFPNSFEDSPLGPIPTGWRVETLLEAYEMNPVRKLAKGVESRYLDMANVPTRGFGVDQIGNRPYGSGSKFVLGDTLLARITPCLENGKGSFVDFLSEGEVGAGSTEFVVMRPRSPLPPFHAYLLSRHPVFREHAIQSMSGTSGRQRVVNSTLSSFLVAVPTAQVCEKFSSLIDPIQRGMSNNYASVRTLAELRDSLLPRLISGRLRVPEAEQEITERLSGQTKGMARV
jgi:type I restriction enzyme, S subunit